MLADGYNSRHLLSMIYKENRITIGLYTLQISIKFMDRIWIWYCKGSQMYKVLRKSNVSER